MNLHYKIISIYTSLILTLICKSIFIEYKIRVIDTIVPNTNIEIILAYLIIAYTLSGITVKLGELFSSLF